jgi:multiple sugar transport system ATP-binding protein
MDVAAFIGSPPMNLFEGRLDGRRVTVGDYSVELPQAPDRQAGPVVVGVRPTHISLAPEGLAATLYLSENLGESMLLNFTVGEHLIKVRLPEVRRFDDNQALHLAFDPRHLHLFDPQTRLRIG